MAEKISIRRTRRLRAIWAKHYRLPEPPDPKDSFLDQIVMIVLWLDAPPARARLAYVNLAEEFVDWNELRVSVTSEVAAVLESCGLAPSKGAILKRILGKAVETLYSLDFESLAARSREALRAWFVNIEGVPHHVAAAILYYVYDYDRVLVGPDIAPVVRRLGLVSEAATAEDIEAAMAGVMPAREAHFIYSALRQHALTVCTKKDFDCRACPLRKECDTGKRLIAEMEAAARAARKKARQEARAKARARAKAKAKPKARAKTRPKAKAKSKAKARGKAVARKPTKKKPRRRTRPSSRSKSSKKSRKS